MCFRDVMENVPVEIYTNNTVVHCTTFEQKTLINIGIHKRFSTYEVDIIS